MFGWIIAMHVLTCIFLILVILLQPGKGYGLSETFGGQAQTIFGTRAGTFIARITAFSATLFLITCLGLAVISGKRSRSIMEKIKSEEVKKELPPKSQEAIPPVSGTGSVTPTQPPQPAQQNQ